jgi:uroporphyrin-III C-methyltransferase
LRVGKIAKEFENRRNSSAMAAKVYLVGAGPGDPELLTRKAWRVLQSADVVLHDDLVSAEILNSFPSDVQRVNVGKRCGSKNISQDEINQLMIQLAREGKTVARLKSGDPLLFGRAGEEMEALRAAGIEFEIVPGVTAALGAAASARIPLTDRRYSSRVVFVTAHREGGTGLTSESHIAGDTTYVIYMPGRRYRELAAELQAAGIGAEIPCAVISRATTSEEIILHTTVGQLPNCPAATSPSLLVVGIVAGPPPSAIITERCENDVAGGDNLSRQLREEILQLASQHPYHELHGRGGVE